MPMCYPARGQCSHVFAAQAPHPSASEEPEAAEAPAAAEEPVAEEALSEERCRSRVLGSASQPHLHSASTQYDHLTFSMILC